MGKKKERRNSAQDDEASDNQVPPCTHFRKDLNIGKIKKRLAQPWCSACEDCKDDVKTEGKCEKPDEAPSVWLCLKCGHKGCGRNSEGQHALQHYKEPHSDGHSLALCLENWSAWCYLCDNYVYYEDKDQLGQFVKSVQKIIADKSSKEVTAVLPPSHEKDQDKGKEDNATEIEREKTSRQSNQQPSVKGLSNLGNTCFFNAVLQILSQTYVLKETIQGIKTNGNTVTIITPDSSNLGHLEIHTDQLGPLSSAMHQFLLEIQDTKKSVVTPKDLFTQVCKKAMRFRGYQQQDSQELLHYLLDGMRTEEIKRIGAGIVKALNYSSEKGEDEERERIMKVYEKEASEFNFIDQVFGGILTNTIMCEQCKMVTLVEEYFLDLSLPVQDDQGDKKKSQGKGRRNLVEDNQNENLSQCNGKFVSKDRGDISTSPSKYEQKKAKKQAKKQAKHQQRQQKSQTRSLVLEDSTTLDEEQKEKNDASDESKEDLASNGIEAEVSPAPELDNTDSLLTDQCLGKTTKENMADDGHELSQENVDAGNEDTSDETGPKRIHSNDSHNSNDLDSSDTFESHRVTEDLVSASSEDEETIIKNMNELNMNESSMKHDDEITSNRLEFENSSETTNDLLASIKDKRVVFLDAEEAFRTLSDRKLLSVQECSLEACLRQFTQIENLTGANKLLCEECTRRQYKSGSKINANDIKHVYTDAKKQILVSSSPPILTLNLKRFEQLGFALRKINKHINFPQVLDLAPFCTTDCNNIKDCTNILYSLYGVVEQSGTMRSGHYTAYVKTRTPNTHLSEYVLTRGKVSRIDAEAPRGRWFHVSDSHVQEATETKVLNAQAYLLFYERI